ncbi:SIS domain-containing protein [Candidatus Pelagibacter sp.]|uniref:SIS domain-containing protein n=1 Tax=Candidatus Pelagibacter sp. TaxID=2024849 RepID=UPI003F86BEF1
MLSCKDFFLEYNKKLSETLKRHHYDEIERITKFLETNIKLKKKIFVCGNGGSASIANHFLCDFNKGIKASSSKKIVPEIISLTNSIELITAIANDIDFGEIFASQLENYGRKNDILIVISSSGKSKNIINAVKFAKKNKLKIISLIGFSENYYLKKISEHYINLNTKNYGITEDIFQSIMHMISQYLRLKNSKNFKGIL